jgi:hypothetical protein
METAKECLKKVRSIFPLQPRGGFDLHDLTQYH